MMASTSESPKLFLWDHPLSGYAQKVRIALRYKKITFDMQTPGGVGSGLSSATVQDFAASNPRIEVPVLVDGDLNIFDSTIILEYLENKYPNPSLLPPSPAARAKARMIEEVCDTQYEGLNWALGEIDWFRRADPFPCLETKLKAQAKHQTEQLLDWLTKHLGNSEWFNGERFGWADLCVVPFLSNSIRYRFGPEQGTPCRSGMLE
jgi:glutathione S-transferase